MAQIQLLLASPDTRIAESQRVLDGLRHKLELGKLERLQKEIKAVCCRLNKNDLLEPEFAPDTALQGDRVHGQVDYSAYYLAWLLTNCPGIQTTRPQLYPHLILKPSLKTDLFPPSHNIGFTRSRYPLDPNPGGVNCSWGKNHTGPVASLLTANPRIF